MEQKISISYRPKQAAELLGISLPTLYRLIKINPDFPRPRKVSERVTVFDGKELMDYRDNRKKTTLEPAVKTEGGEK